MQKLSMFIHKNSKCILFLGIFFYCVILITVSYLKLRFHLYNSLDLAIFSHVLWNSVEGSFLFSNIHPPSYFGDHISFVLIVLIPMYALFPSPLTLLFIQTIALGLTALPLYCIARTKLTKNWSLLVAFMWLFNPYIHFINLFEFHIISLFPVLVLTLWLLFIKNRLHWYIVLLGVTLVLREDTVFALIGLAAIQFLSKKINQKNIIYGSITLISAVIWLIIAKSINDTFTLEGSYKFLAYYEWLGSQYGEITKTIFTKPLFVLKNVVTFDALLFGVLLFLPQLFIPLLKPKYLLGMVLPIAVLALSKQGLSGLPVFLHYGVWFHPFIFLSLTYALHHLVFEKNIWTTAKNNKNLILVVLISGTLAFSIMISPALYTVTNIAADYENAAKIKHDKELVLKKLKDKNIIIASHELLTDLAHTQNLHYVRYLYSDRYQLSTLPYIFPKNPNALVYVITDSIIYERLDEKLERFPSEPRVLSDFVETNMSFDSVYGNVVLFTDKKENEIVWYKEHQSIPANTSLVTGSSSRIQGLAWNARSGEAENTYLHLYVTLVEAIEKPINWEVKLETVDGKASSKFVPPSLGLRPANTWPEKTIIETLFVIDSEKEFIKKLTLTPVTIQGNKVLGRDATTQFQITGVSPFDSPIEILF